jgi:Na+-driven multidrug efflux pump
MIDIGLPAGGEFGLMSVYAGVVYWIIRDFGSAAQAGFGIGVRLMQAIMLPAMAISFAVAPVAGQNFGARRADRVRQTFLSAAAIGTLLMLLVTALCHLSPQAMIRLFSKEPEVVAFGAEYMRIISYNFVASGLIFTCSGLFQALGNTWPPLGSSLTRLLLFAIPAMLLSQRPGFEIRDVWHLSVATVCVQAVVSLLLLRRELERKLRFAVAAAAP